MLCPAGVKPRVSTREGWLTVTAEPVSAPPAGPVEGAPVRGMADGGQRATVKRPAPLPSWPEPRSEDEVYVPEEEFDITDLSEINRQLLRAKSRLFRVSQHLKQAQRDLIDAQLTYRRAYRRHMVMVSGGTEASRKAMVEINCEDFENAVEIAVQVVDEWKKRSQDCRDDLKAIESLGHNVRAQMNMLG